MRRKRCFFSILMMTVVILSFAQQRNEADSVISKTVELDEIVVNAALVKHDSRSDEYIMTSELCQGASSVYDVLSRLPGVVYNNIGNTVSVRMDSNVLIEVDGMQVSPEYLQALPVSRISRIQIVYAPTARYSTAGIRYVINVKLKNDFVGHELYASNYTMISAGDNNGSDIVANEQPKIQYTYSGENVDLTAGYGYGTIHWNYPVSYSRNYIGIASVSTSETGPKSPNDQNGTNSHAANLGINWQIAPYQTFAFQGMFHNDKVDHKSFYDVRQLGHNDGSEINYRETAKEFSLTDEISAAIYYQGMFRNGWSIYSAFGYDRLRDRLSSEYSGYDTNSLGRFREAKDYYRGELNLNYSFNDATSINFGYRGIWNRYATFDRDDNLKISEYEDNHHNGYVFFDWTPGENLLLNFGSGVEAIRKKNFESSHNWLKILPQVTVTWQPSEKVQLMGEYMARIEYPSLYQVAGSYSYLDKWLSQTGNPQLTPSRNQTVSLQSTFFDSLIIGAEYIHSQNSITEWYEKSEGNSFLKTFTNCRNREFRAIAAYDWEIISGLVWKNIFQWQWKDISGHGLSNHAFNFSWNSNVEYWIDPIGLLARMEYSREMQKFPLLQGWQQFGQDLWQFSLRKSFINNSIAVSLNYVLPIHMGVRRNQQSCIETPLLNLKDNLNLRTYDNLLMFRIEWRFNKGRNKQRRVHQYEFESEVKQDKGLL